MTTEDEGRGLADRKLAELSALSWEELDRYQARAETVTLGSGRRFRVKSMAYWDMDPWQSDMQISVKVYSARGWRRYWPYKARTIRPGENLPESPPSPL